MRVVPPAELERRAKWSANCGVCGVAFGWAKNGDKAKFCSRVCAGKNNGTTKNRPIEKIKKYECRNCKNEFLSYYKSRTYCSMRCTADYRHKNGQPMRYSARLDNNHREIVNALIDFGVSVLECHTIGRGFPDLIIGYCGITTLMEIKNPKTQYGRAGLNKNQRKWQENWKGGPIAVVYDIDGAIRVAKTMKGNE